MDDFFRRLFLLVLVIGMWHGLSVSLCAAGEGKDTGFEIRGFEVTGNTVFQADKLKEVTAPFTGAGKTAGDVEKARDAIEKLYHDAGYPAVMVNIPEQTLKEGIVRLRVIESRIGRVTVTGNRYFTGQRILSELPSLSPGKILYLPDVQQEIGRLNRTQDLKVDPVMLPGREPGTIDIQLKVADKLPLHGYLEINNRQSPNTTDLRINVMLRYDNLWQMDHSVAVQYQTSPRNTKEVGVIGGSYSLPVPWNTDQQMAFYGIWSNSDTVAFADGFRVIGKGEMFGIRYVMPLPQYRLYAHNITLGLDYKHFDQAVGLLESGQTVKTPLTYLPLSFSYSASLPDGWGGTTQFSGGLNVAFRGVVTNEDEFETARFNAGGNYLYFTAGVQRNQKLPLGMGLFLKADGQIADQPLVSNEQYAGGGMENVRGYMEDEVMGDNAVHGTVEVSFPDPVETFLRRKSITKWVSMSPYVFYDIAVLNLKDPLAGQDRSTTISGTGGGIRGFITKRFEYEMDLAVALNPTDQTERYDKRLYFKLRGIL